MLDIIEPPPCSARRPEANVAATLLPILPAEPVVRPPLPVTRREMTARGLG